MFFPDKADVFRSFISHTTSTSKVAAGIVMSAAMVVAIGAVQPPGEAFSPVDMKEVQQASTTHFTGAPPRLLFVKTDPAWYSDLAASKTADYVPPTESPEIEASMVNGHIQAF